MFLVIVVIQNTLEKPYLTNAHMKKNSRSVRSKVIGTNLLSN